MVIDLSAYLLGSTHADDVLMCIFGRVSVARMATDKPYGWVHASLERVRMGTFFPKWSEQDDQIDLLDPCEESLRNK